MNTYPMIYFIIFAAIFLFSMLFINRKFFNISILIYFCFLIISYVMISNLLGSPKPIIDHVPLYSHLFTKENPPELIYGFVSDDKKEIYLLLKEDGIKLYSIKYNQKFMDELNKILSQTGGHFHGILLSGDVTDYNDLDTSAHVYLARPQDNHFQAKPDSQEGVDTYNVR